VEVVEIGEGGPGAVVAGGMVGAVTAVPGAGPALGPLGGGGALRPTLAARLGAAGAAQALVAAARRAIAARDGGAAVLAAQRSAGAPWGEAVRRWPGTDVMVLVSVVFSLMAIAEES
jgi:hypothetical protein